jgi:anaerobic glycerol-3-phosphate dehydrogenase
MEEGRPEAVVRRTTMDPHPLMAAGVQVNAACQPLRQGRVAFANLFAAGMVIGGFASRYALCADGIALATGAVAAQGALRQAGGDGL